MNEDLNNSMTDSLNLRQFILLIQGLRNLIFRNLFKLIIASLLGFALGLIFYWMKPSEFHAKESFLVEEGRTSSGISGIAGQLGLDIGSLATSTGGISIFTGDNILLFLKSDFLCKKTLLTSIDSLHKETLADRFAEVYDFKEKWKKSKEIGENINFPLKENTHYSTNQDSLLSLLSEVILKKHLFVERPEKKATFITVEVDAKDALFSKLFCERLVQNAIEKYVEIKTRRQKTNVYRLQRRADSIESVLNNKTYVVADELEKVIDANPGVKKIMVNSEINSRDRSMLSVVYGEVIKSLEIAKINLNQETPVVQIVDLPSLPMKNYKTSKFVIALIGSILTTFAFLIYLIFTSVRKKYK